LDYLDLGGFPAYRRERDPQILQELLRDVVQRDIAVRHAVRQTRHLMNLALFLLANTGRPFSLQGLTKGLAIPTVGQTSRAVEYLEDAYLLLGLPRFSPSVRRRAIAPRKYYAIDNGLRRAVSPRASPDVGHRLENAVFLELRRRAEPLAYASERDGWECDFVTAEEAIQVCAVLTPENREREVRGLLGALALPGGPRRPLLLTLDQRDEIQVGRTRLPVRPAWEWMG
jgi:hypothetical protein